MKSSVLGKMNTKVPLQCLTSIIGSQSAIQKPTRSQLLHQISTSQSIGNIVGFILGSIGVGADLGLPSKILFVQNIPSLEAPEERLNSLFASHLGFKEVRLVPSKKDIAFVEYENDVFANAARLALDKYQILPSHEIRVSFSKK